MTSPLSRYRAANGLTLEAVAEGLGVNKSTVLRWEEGSIPAERIIQIEQATGIPRSELRPDLYPAPSESERAA